jgi:hypothetical protein
MIPLMLVSQLAMSLKEDSNENISGAALGGKVLAFALFAYVFWLSYRTGKIYDGKCPRNMFKPLKKSAYQFAYAVMIVFFLVWIFLNWELGRSGFGVFEIIMSVMIGIFPFHILNIVYYLRDNKLVTGLSSQMEINENH